MATINLSTDAINTLRRIKAEQSRAVNLTKAEHLAQSREEIRSYAVEFFTQVIFDNPYLLSGIHP